MRAVIVVTLDLPDPEGLAAALTAMDIPNIPHAVAVHAGIDPKASRVIEALDTTDPAPSRIRWWWKKQPAMI